MLPASTPHMRSAPWAPTVGARRLIFGSIETILQLFTDHLICVSDDEHAHAPSLGMPARKLSVIVNGVAPPPLDMAKTVRASFGISDDAFVFGFVGRLSYQKAPERLIEAFRNAASRLPDAQLIIVGSGEHRPPLPDCYLSVLTGDRGQLDIAGIENFPRAASSPASRACVRSRIWPV